MSQVLIDDLEVSAYTVPTEQPESDGTLTWDATTVVVVEALAGGERSIGFTYATPACVRLIDDVLEEHVVGRDALDIEGSWSAMIRANRNMGRPGISSMSIAAVDCALWDLKARLLGVPLASLIGRVREEVPIYGSGGFTSLTDEQLESQLSHWVHDQAIPRVKIKIGEDWGRCVERDLERIGRARDTIGADAELYVDANGGYSAKQAIHVAERFSEHDVRWFEEPVSSDHRADLAQIRAAIEPDVAAGEYGYDLFYFEALCDAGAVDCLQADASRCAGISEWLRAAAVADSHGLEISAHCAPSLHAHPAACVSNLRHVEYFYDHARVDRLLFDGVLDPEGGVLRPDMSRPGLGLELKREQAAGYRVA